MLALKSCHYKYYRMIPKGWRQYVKDAIAQDYKFNEKKKIPKMPKRNQFVKEPHLFLRGRGFRLAPYIYVLSDVPPAATGGLTECYLVYQDENGQEVQFVGKIKCSNKDIFCYKTGRDLARIEAAILVTVYLNAQSFCNH